MEQELGGAACCISAGAASIGAASAGAASISFSTVLCSLISEDAAAFASIFFTLGRLPPGSTQATDLTTVSPGTSVGSTIVICSNTFPLLYFLVGGDSSVASSSGTEVATIACTGSCTTDEHITKSRSLTIGIFRSNFHTSIMSGSAHPAVAVRFVITVLLVIPRPSCSTVRICSGRPLMVH